MTMTQPVRREKNRGNTRHRQLSVAPKERAPKQRAKQRRRGSTLAQVFPFFVVLAIALAAVLLINSAQKALIAQGSVDLERLKGEYLSAKELNETLKVERAKLISPERIEQVAMGKLKMVKPAKVSYIKLEPAKAANKDSLAMAGGTGTGSFLGGIWERMGALYSDRVR